LFFSNVGEISCFKTFDLLCNFCADTMGIDLITDENMLKYPHIWGLNGLIAPQLLKKLSPIRLRISWLGVRVPPGAHRKTVVRVKHSHPISRNRVRMLYPYTTPRSAPAPARLLIFPDPADSRSGAGCV